MDDRSLVAALLKKEADAEDLFYQKYRTPLYKAAVYFLGYQDPEAEDVVQETFMAALASLETFEFRSSLETWLNRICVNHCYRRIRSRQKTLLGQEADLAAAFQAPTKGDDPLSRLLKEEQRSQLGRAIQAIKGHCRVILKLRDQQELPYAGIARKLRVPIGTVMSRLARCRELLKRQVEALMERKP